MNCYSPTEDVLGNAPDVGAGGAWSAQEFLKGTGTMYLLPRVRREGGWGFNPEHTVPLSQNGEQLKTSPFFSGFHDETIFVTSNGVDIASNLELRARVLAYGIPAESFSVGTGALGEHFLRETDMVEQNLFDEGGNRKSGSPYWRHSDFIALPVKWTFSLFADIVNQINQGGSGNER